MTGIFISYSRKDSAVAKKLITSITALDLDVWVDWEDIPPAVGWLDQILQGIEAADAFLFLVSPDSIASEVCKVELEHAYKNAKRIIPIVVRDVDPRSTVSIIRDLNWVFIRETDDFDAGMGLIKVAVNLDVNWLQEHRRLQVRALEWDRKKDPSLLLRGSDLRNALQMTSQHEAGDPKTSDLQKLYIVSSRRNERVRTFTWISAALAVLIMIFLSYAALQQRQEALVAKGEADANAQEALFAKGEAETARDEANKAKEEAVESAYIAQAQRSAARAQIFQSRTGGLFTSTLLAIDSWTKSPNAEAEEILRANVSLLPAPVSNVEQGGAITTLEVNPDGLTFASGSNDGQLCLNRFEDGEVLFCATNPGSVVDAAYHPDGSVLAVSDDTGLVQILDSTSGEVLNAIKYGVPILDVNISPDGKFLVIARNDGRVTFIDMVTFKQVNEFYATGSIRLTAFSPDGEWLAVGSNQGVVNIWNLTEEGGPVASITHRGGDILDIAFSPDGQRLLSGGSDKNAILSVVETGRPFYAPILNEDSVRDVAFSPDGSWFVTASDDFRIRIWDTKTGTERLRILQDSLASEIKVSPDGQWIATTGPDTSVHVWRVADGAEAYQIPLGSEGKHLDFNLDGSQLVVGDAKGIVSIWNLSELKSAIGYLQFSGPISNLELSPSGETFAASVEGQVWLLNSQPDTTRTVNERQPLVNFFTENVAHMAFHPDGIHIAISTKNGRVTILNTRNQSQEVLSKSGTEQWLAFPPDGSYLIMAGSEGLVQYRSLDGAESGTLLTVDSAIVSMVVSQSGLAAIGVEGRVIVIDLSSRTVLQELRAPGINKTLAFDATGLTLASNTNTGTTYIWEYDGQSFNETYSLPGELGYSLAFQPVTNHLLIGLGNQVLVLNSKTGEEVYRIRQKGAVSRITFLTDGTLLMVSQKSLQYYNASGLTSIMDEDLVTAACSRLLRNFTPEEWTSFFEQEKYRKLCPDLE
ncbi:MAG: TIR domain-containing protein [Anaerolineae bacterium]|nr:TIR domain-containing protein [Anaerolineae bacterium]